MADRFQNMPASNFPAGTIPPSWPVEGSVLVDTTTKTVVGQAMDDAALAVLNVLASDIAGKSGEGI